MNNLILEILRFFTFGFLAGSIILVNRQLDKMSIEIEKIRDQFKDLEDDGK